MNFEDINKLKASDFKSKEEFVRAQMLKGFEENRKLLLHDPEVCEQCSRTWTGLNNPDGEFETEGLDDAHLDHFIALQWKVKQDTTK